MVAFRKASLSAVDKEKVYDDTPLFNYEYLCNEEISFDLAFDEIFVIENNNQIENEITFEVIQPSEFKIYKIVK